MTQRGRDLLVALLRQLVDVGHFASEADRAVVLTALGLLADECNAAPGDLRTLLDRTPDEPAPDPNFDPVPFAIVEP